MINADFRKLWLGKTISEFGTWLGALGLLAILQLNATPVQMGTLETLTSLPALLIGLFAGAWVDRLRRRPLLILADLGRAILLAGVVLLAFTVRLEITHLYVVGVLVGACTVIFETAWQAYVPSLVHHEQLVTANSRLSASTSVAEVASPGLGGVLVQLVGAPLTVFLDAVSFLLSALAIGSIRRAEQAVPMTSGGQNIWREIGEGLRLVRADRRLRALTGAAATTSFFGGFFGALYVLFALTVIGLNPAVMGLLIGAGGLGSLLAAAVIERVARRFSLGRTLVVTLFLSGTLELFTPLAALPGAPAVLFLLIAQLVADVFGASHAILATTLRQTITPSEMLGRVNASVSFVAGGLGTAGLFIGGLLGKRIGMTPTLIIAATGIALSALWFVGVMGEV